MTAPFDDYCKMNHLAKQVGGPKTYSSILVMGGMALGAVAFHGLPKFAAWMTSKIDDITNRIKLLASKDKKASGISAESGTDSNAENDAVLQIE